ncbi:hypothetical protein [Lentzea indica]|nr:hypothetical protein [Lentzea indica]
MGGDQGGDQLVVRAAGVDNEASRESTMASGSLSTDRGVVNGKVAEMP